jgi:hypothetical protein
LLPAQTAAERLKDVKAIYVAPLTGQDQSVADMLHAKLISYLAKIPALSIVESQDDADAVLLLGSYQIQNTSDQYGRPHYRAQGAARLTKKDGGVVLWAEDLSSSPLARSATSSLAENLAKKLGRVLAESKKK